MIDEVIKMGDFKYGDRVRVKYEHQGKTYAARAKRQGIWIVDKFLQANLELRRPADVTVPHGHFKRLRAKPYMLEKVEPKPQVEELKPTLQSIHLGDVHFTSLGYTTSAPVEAEVELKSFAKQKFEITPHHWTEEYNTADVKIT